MGTPHVRPRRRRRRAGQGAIRRDFVNLVVDGEVVRTATGADSETLDWASWNVKEFAGREASIRVVDNNRFGWGPHPARPGDVRGCRRPDEAGELRLARLGGRDYYASVSYFGTPAGSRIMQGWMNNWDYANDIPTSTWRSSMSLPREVTLVSTPEGPRLVAARRAPVRRAARHRERGDAHRRHA